MSGGRRVVAWLLAAIAVTSVACGDEEPPAAPVAAKVDAALAPATVLDGALGLYENTSSLTRKAFASAGDRSLTADGRLFEIRRADRLVGTLQLSAVVDRVDLTDAGQRAAIVRDVLSGSDSSIRVGDVEVYGQKLGEKAVYVWFGQRVVQVLTVKEVDEVKADAVLGAVIAHQATTPAWEPLPLEVEIDEGAE